MGYRGQVPEPRKVPGFHPGPHQEAHRFASRLNPGPPPRAVALGTINLVGSLRRADRGLSRSWLALLREPTNGRIAKAVPLLGLGREANLWGNAPGGSEGGALALPRPRHVP